MEWTQFVIFAFGVFGLFIWNRTESRADMRYMNTMLESNRNLIIAIQSEIQSEMKAFQSVMAQETKDFHGKLCAIDERTKK